MGLPATAVMNLPVEPPLMPLRPPVAVPARQGDEHADEPVVLDPAEAADFATFYEANIDALIGALSAALIDPGLAQDAAQEAMARACQRWKKVGQYDNPMGWCYRVAMNWTTSRWRKRKREVTTNTFSPAAAIANVHITDYSLVDALMQLDLDQRSVVVLRLWMDWSVEATAEALGVPTGTVASRLHRALGKLRVILDEPVDQEVSHDA